MSPISKTKEEHVFIHQWDEKTQDLKIVVDSFPLYIF